MRAPKDPNRKKARRPSSIPAGRWRALFRARPMLTNARIAKILDISHPVVGKVRKAMGFPGYAPGGDALTKWTRKDALKALRLRREGLPKERIGPRLGGSRKLWWDLHSRFPEILG